MTKLHLKRTQEEEHQQSRRKAFRAAKKAAKRKRSGSPADSSGRYKRHCTVSDDDEFRSSSSSLKPDHDAIRTELEEMRFREKMWDAFEDDERLDGINARFSDYAHIPDRWSLDEHDLANPQYMDEDEYAEWIRLGMWKKKHAREYEEQAKRDTERAAQRTRERQIKAETSRLEELATEREERRRREKQRQREDDCRRQYEHRWKALFDPQTQGREPLTFQDIPWPIFSPQYAGWKVPDTVPLRAENLTPDTVALFLLPLTEVGDKAENDDTSRRDRDKLKETLLRFHPDKFEGRVMHRVLAGDVERVREAVGHVVRALNTLMSGKS